MPERGRGSDLNERFSLYPETGEKMLLRLLGTDDEPLGEYKPAKTDDS